MTDEREHVVTGGLCRLNSYLSSDPPAVASQWPSLQYIHIHFFSSAMIYTLAIPLANASARWFDYTDILLLHHTYCGLRISIFQSAERSLVASARRTLVHKLGARLMLNTFAGSCAPGPSRSSSTSRRAALRMTTSSVHNHHSTI